uniref:Uncharacterized protein n=1 Tax=Lepeophtheirus salmonis TaxID=72036 RepID=A0A0K2UGM5_LEPSM
MVSPGSSTSAEGPWTT